jgi:hypothetical protein
MAPGAAVRAVSKDRAGKAMTRQGADTKSATGVGLLRATGFASARPVVDRARIAKVGRDSAAGASLRREPGSRSVWRTAARETSKRARRATNEKAGMPLVAVAKCLTAHNFASAPHQARHEANATIGEKVVLDGDRILAPGLVGIRPAEGRVVSATRIATRGVTVADLRRAGDFRGVRMIAERVANASMVRGLMPGAAVRRQVFVSGSAKHPKDLDTIAWTGQTGASRFLTLACVAVGLPAKTDNRARHPLRSRCGSQKPSRVRAFARVVKLNGGLPTGVSASTGRC